MVEQLVITPTPITGGTGVDQAAPDAEAPAQGFAEALAGAGNQASGPPGTNAPPGVATLGEGVQTREPNAQSDGPDFLPKIAASAPATAPSTGQIAATNIGADLVILAIGTPGKSPSGKAGPGSKSTAKAGAEALASTVGSLALQLTPQASPLQVSQAGQPDAPESTGSAESPGAAKVAGASAVAVDDGPTAPQLDLATAQDPPLLTLVQGTDPQVSAVGTSTTDAAAGQGAAQAASSSAQAGEGTNAGDPGSATTASSNASVSPPSWQATVARGLEDAALTAKVSSTLPSTGGEAAMVPFPDPTQPVVKDFFEVQFQMMEGATPNLNLDATAPPGAGGTQAVKTVAANPAGGTASASGISADATANAQQVATPIPTAAETAAAAPAGAPAKPPAAPKDDTSPDASQQVAKPTTSATSTVQASSGTTSGDDASANGEGQSDSKPATTSPSKPADDPRATSIPDFRATAVAGTSAPVSQAAGARSQPLTSVETGQVIRQIVDRAEALAAANPRDGVVVQLEPKNLGSITLVVKAVGNQVDAQIGATNEHVRTALDQARGLLGQAMESRGLTLNSVSIDNQTMSGTSAQTQQQTQQQDNRQAQVRQAATVPDDKSATLDLDAIHKSVRKASGVDIWT